MQVDSGHSAFSAQLDEPQSACQPLQNLMYPEPVGDLADYPVNSGMVPGNRARIAVGVYHPIFTFFGEIGNPKALI
jgi:hypothetical protein